MRNLMKLGDMDVGRIGLGTNRLIKTPGNIAFVKTAVAAGIQMIDTAHSYTGGQSEETIGEALSPIPETYVVATKGGIGGAGRAAHPRVAASTLSGDAAHPRHAVARPREGEPGGGEHRAIRRRVRSASLALAQLSQSNTPAMAAVRQTSGHGWASSRRADP